MLFKSSALLRTLFVNLPHFCLEFVQPPTFISVLLYLSGRTFGELETLPASPGHVVVASLSLSSCCTKTQAPHGQIGGGGPSKSADTGGGGSHGHEHWLINYMDTKAKCRHLKNWPRDFAAGVYLSEAPSHPYRFLFGWCSSFVGSESVKLLQNMVYNRTPYPSPLTHSLYTYINYAVYFFTQGRGEGGGRVEPERKLEGQQFTKLGRKYQHDYKLW